MDIKTLLGKRIREVRQNHNYTQSEMAEFLGIDDKHLSRVELGKNMPNPVLLGKIVKLFNIEVKDLFEFSHLEEPKILRKNLIELVNKMNDEQIVLMYKYARSFVI